MKRLRSFFPNKFFNNKKYFAFLFVGLALTVAILIQLFFFETFSKSLVSVFGAFFGQFIAFVIVFSEILALPFLLSVKIDKTALKTSKKFVLISAVLLLFYAIFLAIFGQNTAVDILMLVLSGGFLFFTVQFVMKK